MLANWGFVFSGNLIGSVAYGALLAIALTNFGTAAPAGVAAKIIAVAEAKTTGYAAIGYAGLITVFVKAILCNWMVCLAIVASMTTNSTIGKIATAYMAENACPLLHNFIPLRGAVARDPRIWAKYIGDAIALYGKDTDILIGQHHWPTWGREAVLDHLEAQRDLYKHIHDQTLRHMSGGEQQMCAIGRALMSDPKLLLLDEPSAGLAPVVVQQVFELVKRIRASGLTVLIVEQNVQQVLKVVDRAYLLEAGTIRASGTAAEMRESDTVKQAYLGV